MVRVEDVNVQPEVAPGGSPSRTVGPDTLGKYAVVGIAVAASLGLLPWLRISMFADEGATLYSAHLSWSNLWSQSQFVDLVLLPYYVLIHVWLIVSGSIAWVRALSLLAYFGTIVVIGRIGLRIAGRWCGIIASLLTATSTLLIEKSLNARPYELSTFLVTLCAVFLLKWLDDSRTRWIWGFSVLALLATAMQLFSLLAPVSMLVGVLVIRPQLMAQRLRALRAPIALFVVAAGAWVVVCMRQVGQVNWIANESLTNRLTAEVRGPVIGQLYDFVLVVIVALALVKLAATWNRDVRHAVVRQVRRDRDFLALTIGWAVVPTVLLSIASFVHPIYSVRYVAASAPGAALLAAFICVRAFPRALDPSRVSDGATRGNRGSRLMVATFGAAGAVLLVIGFVVSAAALQEDLRTPARYVALHAQPGDVIALPDHALTAAVDYYLTSDGKHIPLWPQLGVRQRYVEGLDLSLHPPGGLPKRVWLMEDGSVSVTHFERVLERDGYVVEGFKAFEGGSALVLFHSTVPDTRVLIPSSGATLRGPVAILVASAWAYRVHTVKVQFVLSGGPYSKMVIGTAGYTKFGAFLPWNSTSVSNGTYLLQSVATSGSGQTSYSPAITVKVSN